MIVPVMAISNLVLTQQIYSEETNGPHAHYREPVPLITHVASGPILIYICALLFLRLYKSMSHRHETTETHRSTRIYRVFGKSGVSLFLPNHHLYLENCGPGWLYSGGED